MDPNDPQIRRDDVERLDLEREFRVLMFDVSRFKFDRLVELYDKGIRTRWPDLAPHEYIKQEGWHKLFHLQGLAKEALAFQGKVREVQENVIPRPFNRGEFEEK